jgi:hypothetical protein
MSGEILASFLKYLYSSVPNTAMSGVAAYPASGSYVNVDDFVRVHIICTFGTIHTSDSPTVTVKQTDAVNGTLDEIDNTNLAYTPAPDSDDNLAALFTIEVASLKTNHHFLAVATSGTLTNGSYCHVQMFGEPKDQPPTQAATVVDYQYSYAGGQAVAA